MFVYKYKSLGNSTCSLEKEKQFGYLKDICTNGQLYASNFDNLDDPMEGIFNSYRNIDDSYLSELFSTKNCTHICSLSPTYQSMLMWSFYANQHKGCCIEVELLEDEPKTVNYVTNPMDVDTANLDNEGKIEQILLRKYLDWAFENELRVLTKERFVKVRVNKVYFGMRISNDLFEKYKTDIQNWNEEINVDKMREDMFIHINTNSNNQ